MQFFDEAFNKMNNPTNRFYENTHTQEYQDSANGGQMDAWIGLNVDRTHLALVKSYRVLPSSISGIWR